jgi:predicted GNAT family N-acyltransferase
MQFKRIRLEETYPLRKSVLRKGISLPHKFQGDEDAAALHFGVEWNGSIQAIASFLPVDLLEVDLLQYQLRGMAVNSQAQGMGLGGYLISAASAYFSEKSVDLLWCNARQSAYQFYQKNGFENKGEEFEVDQIGTHDKMFKYL